MANKINGFKDIHKLLVNERKIGGVIEVNTLRLRTGEVYQNAVITHIYLMDSSHLFNWIYNGGSAKYYCEYR